MKYFTRTTLYSALYAALYGAFYFALIALGLWLDQQTTLSQLPLIIAFHGAGIVGLITVLIHLRQAQVFRVFWHYLLLLILAYVVWRIAYFPILVLAGYVASLGEAISLKLGQQNTVYPLFLLSMALMNAGSLWLASQVLIRILRPRATITRQETTLLATSIPLAILATTVSFTQATDWHTIPDTSFIDDKPLPQPALPEMNPYYAVLADQTQTLNWRQRTLFYASAITYDLIPEQTHWARIVRGTLEQEFVNTSNVSTEFCVKVHYRAFRVAQPFLHSSTNTANTVLSGETL